MRRRLYKWATKETEGAKYERIFNFKSGKEYGAMRYHFVSLGEEAELEMTAELQEFREQNVERILYHGNNYYRYQAIKAANSATRDPKPSTALQSPYTQLKTANLESGKSDASK
ncbi:hypothetical protein PIB30_013106 [Stylosanthes scabra]|uniref:Uncharacterized protein n=1 Tax=Stylosanthes scabra TaxID=79078 RepID=A0ABU6V8W3_9FABA|nr:hypothetical protein [Stylosanthes scabra]